MSLRLKTLVFFSTLVLTATVLFAGVHQFVVLPRFLVLEENLARNDMDRVVKALRREIEHLRLMTIDYACWDDSYQFVQDRNPEYVESNLITSSLTDSDLSLVLIADARGEVAWEGWLLEGDEPEFVPLPTGLLDDLRDYGLLAMTQPPEERQGLIVTSLGSLVVCSAPILTSGLEGPAMGRYIMGRLLDEARADRIANQTMVKARFERIRGDGVKPDVRQTAAQLMLEPARGLDAGNPEVFRVRRILADLSGSPAILIECQIPRAVLREGQQAVRYANLAAALISAGFLLAVIIGLQRSIVTRILRLSARVSELGGPGRLSERVEVQGNDEMAQLERDINNMLDQRQRAERELQESEQKYRSFFSDAQIGLCRTLIADGRILDANQRMADLMGYDRVQDFIGQHSTHDLYVNAEDRERMIQSLLRDGSVNSYSAPFRRRDGRRIWVRFSAHLSADRTYLDAAVIDISEQKTAEEELRQSIIQMERFNRLAIGREKRMAELKQEINQLAERLGEIPRYRVRDGASAHAMGTPAERESGVR